MDDVSVSPDITYFYDFFLLLFLPFGPRFVEWNEYAPPQIIHVVLAPSVISITNVVIRQKESKEEFDFVAILT